jgi:UDP-3-O-[3-hydroxymyristoyl] glucosamine N-acyltransferase
MTYTLEQLVNIVGGNLLHPEAAQTPIESATPVHDAKPGSITFLSRDRKLPEGEVCSAAAIIVHRGRGPLGIPTVEVDQPLEAMLRIAEIFLPGIPVPRAGIHPSAIIDPTAQIDPSASIGPFVVIEGHCKVGPRCVIHSHVVIRAHSVLEEEVTLHPHVVLYPLTSIGARTIIHSGVVLGCDGFGYKPNHPVHTKVPQLGVLDVASDCEIGANSTIDRATIGSTTIGMSTKIDNQVMIGHNCQIGPRNILAAQVGISGSCKTGDMVWMAGKVGIADHVKIGDGALLLAYAGIHRDIDSGERVIGVPARGIKEFAVEQAALAKLPALLREFREWRKKQESSAGSDRKCA